MINNLNIIKLNIKDLIYNILFTVIIIKNIHQNSKIYLK